MTDWVEELSPEEREQWEDFVNHFRTEALEKITESRAFISLVPHEEDVDVKFAVELGAAIMLNKPIIAVAFPGVPVPEKLRLIADHVIEGDIDTEEGQKEVAIALSKVIGDPQ